MSCPGCLKVGIDAFCTPCRRRLFDGKKVPSTLTFTRPAYDQAKRTLEGQRLSISGVQTKMPLALRDGRLEMTASGGHYILKPVPYGGLKHLREVPVNEHLTMQLARQVFGISAAENALVTFADGEPAYLVRRFDIRPDGTRSLQEDFAQVAGRSEATNGRNYKYDYSYEAIGDLIRRHVSASEVALERLFVLVVFNYLVHNGDAHLKNFSLTRNDDHGHYTLTPAYDLLNTRLHVPGETRTALDLFKDDFETESYKANAFYAYDDFQEFARRLGLVPARFRRIMRSFLDKEQAVVDLIDRSSLSDECKGSYKAHVRDSIRALGYSYTAARPG